MIAEAAPKPRETIAGFLRRTGWSRRNARRRAWEWRLPTICVVDGVPLLQSEWRRRRIRTGDRVEFWSRPLGSGQQSGGSKNILGFVALIAVAALAIGAPFAAGALGFGFLGAGTVGGALLSAAIGLGGSLLINALTAPKPGAQNSAADTEASSQVLASIQASGNQVRPFAPIPVSYGRIKTYPDFAATPWSEYAGNEQYLNVLLSLGLGKYAGEAVYIDDTLLWSSAGGVEPGFDVQLAFYDPGATVTLFPTNVVSSGEVSGQEITETPLGFFVASASGTKASALAVDLVFPGGLYSVPDNATSANQITSASVTITAEYQEVDDAGAPVGGAAALFSQTFTRASRNPIRETVKVAVAAKRYRVRVYRTTVAAGATSTGQGYRGNSSGAVIDNVAWASLRAFIEGVAAFPVSTVAIRIRADRMNASSARKFGVLRTRVVNVWNGSAFVEQASRNPVWAFYDAVTDAIYGAARPPGKVDFNTVVAAATAAAARGDAFDYEFAAASIMPEALDTILRTTRCRHYWSGDVISLVRDEAQAVPDMLLTDREIVRGSLSIDYALNDGISADAVRLEYVDENTWQPADVQYPPNSMSFTATNPSTVRLDGVIQRAQAHREAAFYYLQSIYRRSTVRLETEWDGRRLAYGSHLRVQSELPQSWGQAAAVLANAGGTLTVSPAPDWSDARSKYVRIRTRTGRVFGPVLCTQGTSTSEIVLNPADLAGVEAAQGRTLAAVLAREDGGEPPSLEFGTAAKTARDCIVLSGRPRGENRIALELAVDNPLIFSTDIGSPQVLPTGTLPAGTKMPIVAGLTASFRQGVAEPLLEASWFPAAGAQFYRARVSYDGGVSYVQIYEGIASNFSIVVDRAALRLQVAGVGATHGPWTSIEVDAPVITIAPGTVDVASLVAGLGDLVTGELKRTTSRIRERMERLETALIALEAKSWTDKKDVRSDIAARAGDLSASIEEVRTVAADAETALADYQLTVTAALAAQSAAITTNATAIADVDGRLVGRYTANISVDGYVTGFWNYNTGTFASFIISADVFQVAWPALAGGDPVPVFQIANVNGVARMALRGDMFADGAIVARNIAAGAITAEKIAAGAITTEKITAGSITTSKLIADAATRLDPAVLGGQTFYFDGNNYQILSKAVSAVSGKYTVQSTVEFGTIADGGIQIGIAGANLGNYDLVAEILVDGTTIIDTILVSGVMYYISGSDIYFRFFGTYPSTTYVDLTAGPHTFSMRIRAHSGASLPLGVRIVARTVYPALVAFESRA